MKPRDSVLFRVGFDVAFEIDIISFLNVFWIESIAKMKWNLWRIFNRKFDMYSLISRMWPIIQILKNFNHHWFLDWKQNNYLYNLTAFKEATFFPK